MEPRTGFTCPKCGYVEGTPPASPFFLPPRTMLGNQNYLLGRVLGAGGFGITYLAWDLNLELKLAIKEYFPNAYGTRDRNHSTVIPANTQSKDAFNHGLEKFTEEAKALAVFHGHPSIPSAMTFFKENGTSYLVMKYEEGFTLKEYLKDHGGRLDFQTVMGIAMPVMDALRAVHQERILHRDISPDNIIINRSRQIKILDFGSAKRDMTLQDATLQITLKRGFSPEEQYRGNGKQGPWTDVYAVGATLYQCLTGMKPPDALERLDHDTIQPPSRLGVDIPQNCERALMKALAVRGPNRWQTMEEFQKAFSRGPDPLPWWRLIQARLEEWLRRRGSLILSIIGVALALIFLSMFLAFLFTVPLISEFSADPSSVRPGQPVTLRWSATGGKLSIRPGIARISQNSGRVEVFPSAPKTTYILTASGPIRSVSRSVVVAVVALPRSTIKFTAEPSKISAGQSTELVWSVEGDPNVVTVDQGVGEVDSSGRVKVTPATDTIYTLKADGPGGFAQASVKVEVITVSRPVVVLLNASPPAIRKGQSTQLTWEVTGENAVVRFDQNIGSIPLKGSLKVSPQQTTTYRLLAMNGGGSVSRSVTVQVQSLPDAPRISSFTGSPDNIQSGQNATLSWSVSGEVNSVSIAPGIGQVLAEGSQHVSPPVTTTYLLTATGPGGTSTLGCSVRVSLIRTPVIGYFRASLSAVAPGQPVALSWQVDGDVNSATLIQEVGDLSPTQQQLPLKFPGSLTLKPVTTTGYTLKVSGPGGTKSQKLVVRVSAEPFAIKRFDATADTIMRGQRVTLNWEVTGPITQLAIEPSIGDLQGNLKGSVPLIPDQTTTYVLTAQAGNKILTKSKRVTVR